MTRFLSIVFALLVSLALTGGASAREEIRNFRADIDVRADASIEVTETITVNAEGRDIRRGIYRDIPLRALDDWGLWSSNGFDLVEVLHNGRPSPYHTEWQGRFFRILIGDADVYIPRGEHTYTIRYVTTRQLRFFEGYDELYWNVTGNFWSFPILAAEATVRLPEGARAIRDQVTAYTGPFGATGGNYTGSILSGGSEVRFALTRPLGPEEGMTIAVGFTEGVVTPDWGGGFAGFADNIGIFLLILGWLGVPAYFLYAWNKVGRDPPSPPVIPLFHPPENLSPAALSYAHFNGFRSGRKGVDLPFIAALLSLGVKRILRIDEDSRGTVTLQRGEAAGASGSPALPGGENALFTTLLSDRDEIVLDKRNGKTLKSAVTKLRMAISREYEGRYYNANIGWFIPGALLAIATFIIGLILQDPPDDGILYLIPVLMTSLFGGGMWIAGRSLFGEGGTGNKMTGGILFILGAAIFLVGVLVVLVPSDLPIYRLAGALVIFGCVVMIAMAWLLGAPTEIGAKVLTDIKGFKLYLETAETNRLNMRDAPKMSEELFERFLPYAAGLGVEKPWSEAWAAELARVDPGREKDYRPQWYRGNSWSPGNIGAAAASSVAAVSAAMAASMPQPKSSSGSSGGGSSGGGGGGGGGGGW
ncbi:DUF2207 domain-containing protein [uncultured Hoeflea sp.]|uniref:DUF2207 domain-containing protein n=1 Tax=uncultured Hoeflea sp. TaxID=538666 RepID=UPI0030EDC37E|tara:strand:+ start:45517 stop:47454 length:1938 start_codon:yes stop_codon:yes gene_type:complete